MERIKRSKPLLPSQQPLPSLNTICEENTSTEQNAKQQGISINLMKYLT